MSTKRSPQRRLPSKKKPSPRNFPIRLTVKVQVSDRALANAIGSSLKPETIHREGVRTLIHVRASGKVVETTIRASDIVALRAASNSFMRFILAAVRSIEAVQPLIVPKTRNYQTRTERG